MLSSTTTQRLAAATALTLGLTGSAFTAHWTSIASAGAMDDADLVLLDTVAATVQIQAGAAVGPTLAARCNVGAMPVDVASSEGRRSAHESKVFRIQAGVLGNACKPTWTDFFGVMEGERVVGPAVS